MTIENICLSGITPTLVPRVQEVPSDVENKIFVVVEVDQSADAPHAIENSRRVYIRTGDGNTPFDLADLTTLERL